MFNSFITEDCFTTRLIEKFINSNEDVGKFKLDYSMELGRSRFESKATHKSTILEYYYKPYIVLEKTCIENVSHLEPITMTQLKYMTTLNPNRGSILSNAKTDIITNFLKYIDTCMLAYEKANIEFKQNEYAENIKQNYESLINKYLSISESEKLTLNYISGFEVDKKLISKAVDEYYHSENSASITPQKLIPMFRVYELLKTQKIEASFNNKDCKYYIDAKDVILHKTRCTYQFKIIKIGAQYFSFPK